MKVFDQSRRTALYLYILIILSITILASSCKAPVPPLQPTVIGIEQGMVYGAGVLINIRNPEKNVIYTATINEHPFELGKLYDIEGHHVLKVTASKGKAKLTSEVSLEFEIDKEPPAEPEITGVENRKTYNSAVRVFALQKSGITYTASIDNSAYVLGSDFNEEGEHELKVYALKQRNGLTTVKSIPFTINKDSYTSDEVAYFFEIAFGSEFGGKVNSIKKWQDDIRVKVYGEATEGDMDALSRVIEELNGLIDDVEIKITDENPNFKVYFIPHEQFINHTSKKIAEENWGLFYYFEGANSVINEAKVLIASDKPNQEERAHLIREEFTQALGLAQDSEKYSGSMFYQGWTTIQDYSAMDKQIISMLYNKNIHPNMKDKEVEQYFGEKHADLNDRYQVFPEDQAAGNSSFLQFRNELLKSIEDRNIDYILQHVDEQFSIHPLSGRGENVFKEYFSLDADLKNSNLWPVLAEGLALGGVFKDHEGLIFETPYTKYRFPKMLDSNSYKVVLGENISMHEQSSATSAVVGLLRYDVVKWVQPTLISDLPNDLINSEINKWEYVETLAGVKGYIQTTDLRSPFTHIITFEKKDDRWVFSSISN